MRQDTGLFCHPEKKPLNSGNEKYNQFIFNELKKPIYQNEPS